MSALTINADIAPLPLPSSLFICVCILSEICLCISSSPCLFLSLHSPYHCRSHFLSLLSLLLSSLCLSSSLFFYASMPRAVFMNLSVSSLLFFSLSTLLTVSTALSVSVSLSISVSRPLYISLRFYIYFRIHISLHLSFSDSMPLSAFISLLVSYVSFRLCPTPSPCLSPLLYLSVSIFLSKSL